MPTPLPVVFQAGSMGRWRIDAITAVAGATLPAAACLDVIEAPATPPADGAAWLLRGVTSNARYTHRSELDRLARTQEGLGRSEATRAALIPIRKNEAWWSLAQDERRAIFEEQSRHIAVGLEYLPAVARRLHHARELGEPFDFLTWFECAPEDAAAFETMVSRLRASPEWRYVDREVDIRLSRWTQPPAWVHAGGVSSRSALSGRWRARSRRRRARPGAPANARAAAPAAARRRDSSRRDGQGARAG